MQNTFPESDLHFTFPDDWVVRKFDETIAYQSLSGHGLKGVDFIALSPDGKLWLMEVKNYRPRVKGDKEYRANRQPPAELSQQIAGKFRDTRRLLRIVDRSLRKRWWFGLWEKWRRLFPDNNSNYWFWTEAAWRAQQTDGIVLVLWMETPEIKTDYDEAVARHLAAACREEVTVRVVEGSRPHDLPIEVE